MREGIDLTLKKTLKIMTTKQGGSDDEVAGAYQSSVIWGGDISEIWGVFRWWWPEISVISPSQPQSAVSAGPLTPRDLCTSSSLS